MNTSVWRGFENGGDEFPWMFTQSESDRAKTPSFDLPERVGGALAAQLPRSEPDVARQARHLPHSERLFSHS
jgi:hypothetical protein